MEMTRKQKRWAAQHDWFIRETSSGVEVRDTSWIESAGRWVTKHIIFSNFKALQHWAGY